MKKIILIFLWGVIPFRVIFAESGGIAPASVGKKKGVKQKVISIHGKLSKITMISTNWVDSFFGNKKFLEEQNGTRIRLFYSASKREFNDLSHGPGFKINLRFPNLEKKFQINFEKKEKEDVGTSVDPDSKTSSISQDKDDKVRAGVSYFLDRLANFETKLSAGVKIQIPPRLFSNLRISRKIELGKTWNLRAISNSFWLQKQGFGQSFSMDFDYRFNDAFLFRWINQAIFLDETDETSVSHGPSLFHRISKKQAISYNARANYSNRPYYALSNIFLSVNFRQNLLESWFYFELVPYVDIPKDPGYEQVLGFSAKLELLIGEY